MADHPQETNTVASVDAQDNGPEETQAPMAHEAQPNDAEVQETLIQEAPSLNDKAPEPEGEMHRGYRGNPPDYDAFHVRDGKEDKSYWTTIGIAYHHRDRKGMNLKLDSIPVDGKITLRERSERLMNRRDTSEQVSPQQGQERHHGPER